MFDGKAFGEAIVTQVRAFVDSALAPVLERVAALENRPAAVDGKDADPAVVQRMVDDAVAKALAGRPAPEAGQPGEKGADGVGVADALIDRDGCLVVTLSDGSMRKLGAVVGKDGADGKDGDAGLDGADGQSWEDMDVVRTGPRTVELSFERGDLRRTFEMSFPVPIYRGVFSEAETYEAGDMVTWGGSLWHCNGFGEGEQPERPGSGTKAWVLAVKQGDKGRPGDPGRDGEDGRPGRDGRDLTQMGMTGAKW